MSEPEGGPVFNEGTIFVFANIIRSTDTTRFDKVAAQDPASGQRLVFDRRIAVPPAQNQWDTITVWLFNATFTDGFTVEVQVNKADFDDQATAKTKAEKFAEAVGRLPKILRKELQTMTIHAGSELFGGGNNGLVIYTDQATTYEVTWKCLHEALAHELVHTSLDADHKDTQGKDSWTEAETEDGVSVSTYSEVDPEEDLAESFVPYIGVRYRPDRVSDTNKDKALGKILHRIAYFDAQNFDMSPLPPRVGPPAIV
ncbi:MAG: hypothetical protein OEO79_05905 [Gemmatimonadota bacterium]|nr:hypothetical protein [Gemmatimonadota bacterium]MDH3423152.1 hypothetical protein [Gemmatimonadota bacterium]